MAERWLVPEKKVLRNSVFNGRTVYARKLVNERGQMAWEVWTWTDDGEPGDQYWIANGEIRECPEPPHFTIGRFISEMNESKKAILLDAIKKWQEEEIEKLCT